MKMLEVLIQSLRICADDEAPCDGCFYHQRRFGNTCEQHLLLAAAAALEARDELLMKYNNGMEVKT